MTTISERTGDIFSAPPGSILIHACNTRGSWGRGVAAAFKTYSPTAYTYQHHHCTHPPSASTPLATHQRNLVGTCLLIPPFPSVAPASSSPASTSKTTTRQRTGSMTTVAQREGRYWIACLFTSYGYGKSVDGAEAILEATRSAVEDLGRQIGAYKARSDGGGGEGKGKGEGEVGMEMKGCWSVRINSGLFGVEWVRTKSVLEGMGVGMVVVRPEEEGEGEKAEGKKVGATGEAEGKATSGRKRKGGEEDGGEGGGKRQTRLRFGKGT